MASESLWRSRMRWRWRGALLWPVFVGLTILDAFLLGELPIAGDGGTAFMPALLLAFFFNLVAVAVIAPLVGRRVRHHWPEMPKVVADDYAGTALVCLVTAGLVAGGLVHRPERQDAEHDFLVQQAAARQFVARRAPAPFRARVGESDTLKLGDEYFRTCVPGPDQNRWFCVFIDTSNTPPGITVDTNRVSNGALSLPAPGG